MSLTTIKNAVAAKIAALTGSSDATEIGMLHNLATRLGLATTNTSSTATTKAGTATVSTDTADLALLTSVLNGPSGNSYVGELRRFGSVIQADQTFYDGTRWLGLGKFESDVTKFDQNIWRDGLLTSNSVGITQKTYTDAFNDVVILNSGKKVCFNSIKVQSFTDPFGTYTTLANANATAYAYNAAADILFYTDGTFIYKSTNDATVNSSTPSEAAWNPSVAYAATAQSMWFSGSRLWVGGRGYIRYTDDNGTTWNSYSLTGITSSATIYVCGLIYDPVTSKLFAITRGTPKSNNSSSATYTCWVSTSSGVWTACTNAGVNATYNAGGLRNTYLLNNVPVYTIDYCANSSQSYYGVISINASTNTLVPCMARFSGMYDSQYGSNTKIMSCVLGPSRLALVGSTDQGPYIDIFEFSSPTPSTNLSTIPGLGGLIWPGTNGDINMAMYYQNNVLYVNTFSRSGITKIPLAGSIPISGFSHIRIS